MKYLKLFLLLALGVASTGAYGQLDKTHYIPPFFAPDSAKVDVGEQWIVISTQEVDPFDVAILRGNQVYDTVSVSQTVPQLIRLGTGFSSDSNPTGIVNEDSLNLVLSQQGYKLSADYPFFTAVYQKSSAQGDVLTCKGETALGTEFYSGHVVGENSSGADWRRGLFTSVMAAFDNTSITISNPKVLYAGQTQNTITVTLNKNESYIVGTSNAASFQLHQTLNDYNGTKITSNKPIAVNTGSWCGSGNTNGQQDVGIDQIVPVNFVGTEYIAVKGEGTVTGEQLIVVATTDGTNLYVNGDLKTTLAQQGDYYIIGRDEYDATNNNMYINATENVYVYQTLSGKESDVSVGLCFLPPLSCLSNREVSISYANQIGKPILSLITELGAVVTINGVSLVESSHPVSGNLDWVTYQISNSSLSTNYNSVEDFKIISSGAINVALSFQSGVIGGAGYYSGFGISPVLQAAPTVDGTEACYPNNAILEAGGYDDYIWYFNGEVISGETSPNYEPEQTGQYRVSGRTGCGVTKASDPYILKTCLTLEGGGVFPEDEGDVMVILRLGLASEDDVKYWYRTQSGTAIGDQDFTATVDARTILAGELFDTVYFSIIDDNKYESADETFIFDVYSSLNATVKNEELEFTIQDNDPMPTVSSDATLNVREDADSVKVSFVKTGSTQDTLYFTYNTTPGTALSGSEYTTTSGILYFAPDEYINYVYVPVLNNDINNYAKAFALRYTDPHSVTLINTNTDVTISDDENMSTCLSIVKVEDGVEEGEPIRMDVVLDKAEGIDITYQLNVNNMTTDSADFTPIVNRTYTLEAGTVDTTFWIQTLEDTLPESDETFSYTLVNVTGASICTGAIEFVIYNDDYIPTLDNDNFVMLEDASMSGNVLTNDVILGDTPVVVAFTSPLSGVLTDHGAGDFTYTPNADFFGVVDFKYSVTDKSGDKREAAVNIEVNNENDLPIAYHDTIETSEDSVVLFFPMANDIDVDNSSLTLASVSGASLGVATIESDYIIYTPRSNVFGNDTLRYFITDGEDDGASADIYVVINPANDVPIGNDDDYTLTEGDGPTSLDVLDNDQDIDISGIALLRIYNVTGGTATIVDNKVQYSLFENFWGAASLSYVVVDAENDSASVQVNLTVTGVNDLPVAYADAAVTNEDEAISISVLDNDSDDDDRGLTLDSMSSPQCGSLSDVSGVITYTPFEDSCGVDSFVYYISDYNDDVASAMVRITINCMGEAPVATDDSYALTEDDPVSVWDVLSNDIDKDNSGLTITSIYGVTSGTALISSKKIKYTLSPNFNGNVAFNYVITDGEGDRDTAFVSVSVASVVDYPVANNDITSTLEDHSVDISPLTNDDDFEIVGFNVDSLGLAEHGVLVKDSNMITYTPVLNYCGRDSFTYRLLDKNHNRATAWVIITIDSVPDCPVAQADAFTIAEDAIKTAYDVLGNDVDIDGNGFILSQIVSVSTGLAAVENGKLDYTPEVNFNGSASVGYEIRNANGDKDTASAVFTITSVNDAPFAVRDEVVTNEDVHVNINVLANDLDIDKSRLNVNRIDSANNGSIVLSDSIIVYTPHANFNGRDSFLYSIIDGEGDTSQAEVLVIINSGNDAPVIVKDTVSVTEDLAQLFNPITNDLDPDQGGLTMVNMTHPEHGNITIFAGQYLYTPDTNFNGVDSVLYTIKDKQDDQSFDWIHFIVAPQNDFPEALRDLGLTNEDEAVIVDVLDNDVDIDDSHLFLVSVDSALHGKVLIIDQKIRYTPKGDFFGQDSFLYYIEDGEGDRVHAILHITVNSISDKPTAVNDAYALDEDDSKTVLDVISNDLDPDTCGLTILYVVGANGGDARIEDNKIAYTLRANFYGNDTISYVLKDVDNDLDTATVFLTVAPHNDYPVAIADTVITNEDHAVVVAVLSNDVDVDHNGLSVSHIAAAKHGTYTLNSNKITYTPTANYHGRDSFQYTITDDDGDEVSAQLLVIINSANDFPVALRDTIEATEDMAIVFAPMDNDLDPDSMGLSMVNMTPASNGKVTVVLGVYTYTPFANFNGLDSVTYTVKDAQGDQSVSLVVFRVAAVNDLPIAHDDYAYTNEDVATSIDVLDNDDNFDIGELTLQSVDTAFHGTTSIVDHKVVYVPVANFSGRDSFLYQIKDAGGDSAKALVTVVINSGNDAPITHADYVNATEDVRLLFNPLSNDINLDAGDLSVSSFGFAKHGSIDTISGEYYYTSDLNFNGQDSVRYTAADAEGDQSMNWVFFTVAPVNDDPVAQNDLSVTAEDQSVIIDVLSNDDDIDDSKLTLKRVSDGLNGQTLILDKKITYAPNPNFFGVDSFSYVIKDGENDSSQARVIVTVNAVSDYPVANSDSFVILEDAVKTLFSVLTNDDDIDNDTLTLVQVYGANGGLATIEGRAIAYTPMTNFNGEDIFNYVVKDGDNDADTSQVYVSVTPQNDAPVGHRDEVYTSEDIAIVVAVLLNDDDIDSSHLKVDSCDVPLHGKAHLIDNKLEYTPNENFFGCDSFLYYLSDGEDDAAHAMVTVVINSINEAPVTLRDTVLAMEDMPFTFNPMSNDLNLDTGVLRMLNMSAAENGVVTTSGADYLYTPDLNFNGTDSITYTVVDAQGDQNMSWVWFRVAPVNDSPIAVDDISFTSEDDTLEIAVLSNDDDIDSSGLTLDTVMLALNGTASVDGRKVVYVPNDDFYGLDSFLYYILDGESDTAVAQIHITVHSVSDVPVAHDDVYYLSEDGAKTLLPVLFNDEDVDGKGLVISDIYGDSLGDAIIESNTIAYTPTANKNGYDTLYYVVRDTENDLDTAKVVISIAALNDAPIAIDDEVTTDEDQQVIISALVNDDDIDLSILSVDSVGDALHGTVLVSADTSTVIYTPSANYFGADSFLYYIKDGEGDRGVAQIKVNIDNVSDYPVATADTFIVAEDNGKTLINVLANDSDVDWSGLTITDVKGMTSGAAIIEGQYIAYTSTLNFFGKDTLSYIIKDGEFESDTALLIVVVTPVSDQPIAHNDTVLTEEDLMVSIAVLSNDEDIDRTSLSLDSVDDASHGALAIVGDQVTYTPAANFYGRDSFIYYITDGDGDFASAKVNVTVNRINELPLANNDHFALWEDADETALDVLSNDKDIDSSGLTIVDVRSEQGGLVGISNKQVVYTPTANFFGDDTLVYVIRDGENDYDTALVYLDVQLVNDLPQAVGDAVTTSEDVSVNISVLSNDIDIDLSGLNVDSVGDAYYGTLSRDSNVITYLPKLNYYGRDSFNYYITDGEGDMASALVKVNVTAVNERPQALVDSFSLVEDASKTAFDVLDNDVDTDTSGLFIVYVEGAVGGVTAIENHQIVYTPTANFFGHDTLTYVIKDGENDFDTTLVYVTVLVANDAPVANADAVIAQEDSIIMIDVLANDVDIDKSILSLDSVTEALHGQLSMVDDTVRYAPEANYFGADFFDYFIVDGEGDMASARVNLTVSPVNDVPVALSDSFMVQEDADAVIFDILANDVSIDGNALHLIELFDVVGGVAQNTLDKLSFKPTANFFGEASLNYVITDHEGDKDTAWVKIDVTGVNDHPKAQKDVVSCQEDSSVVLDLLDNDSDVDKSGLTIDSVYAPLFGEITRLNDTLYYTPHFNFCGLDSFRYYITDGEGDRVGSSVKINVQCVNDAPHAVSDSVSVVEDVAKIFFPMANDVDADDAHFMISFGSPTQGTISNVDANYYYTSKLNVNGDDSVSYTITDVDGLSSEALVYFTVAAVNDAPVAVDDTLTVEEDSVLRFYPSANDVDVEDEDLTQVTIYREPKLGSWSLQGSEITYTPQANIWGADTMTYVVRDSANTLSNVASVFITINSTNEAPIAKDLHVMVEANSNDTTAVLVYAIDPDNSGLDLVSADGAINGVTSIFDHQLVYQPGLDFLGYDTVTYAVRDAQGDMAEASVFYHVVSFYDAPVAHDDTLSTLEDSVLTMLPTLNDMAAEKVEDCDLIVLRSPHLGAYVQDGVSLSYTPTANVWGADTMTYVLRDSNLIMSEIATIFITIDSVNEAPIATTLSVRLDEDATDTTEVLNLASDPDFSGLRLAIGRPASHGISTLIDSRMAYTPTADFNGQDTAYYWLIDGEGDSTESFVDYQVSAINDVPVASHDTVSVFEDNVLTMAPMLNDVDAEDAVLKHFMVLTLPTHGAVEVDSLNLVYTPQANVWGTDSLTYVVRDTEGAISNEATVYITIDSVNESPLLVSIKVNVTEDASDTTDVLTTAQDLDFSGLTLASVTGARFGSASIVGDKVVYAPQANFVGKDTVTYCVHDGENDTTAAFLCYTVLPINDDPIAVNDTMTVLEDNVLYFSPLNNDVDAEDGALIDFTVLTYPKLGALVVDSLDFRYTPQENRWGHDTITYIVRDAQRAMSEVATIYITVDSVNEAPILRNISVDVREDRADTTNVMLTAQDPDFSGLKLAVVGHGKFGSASMHGNDVIYTPEADFIGKDTVAYCVHDGENDTTLAYVCYNVIPVNDAPVANDDTLRMMEDATDSIYLLANDTDAEDSVLNHFTIVDGPTMGTYTTDSVTVVYTPDANVWGVDSLTYRVADCYTVESEIATLYFIIDSINESPLLSDFNVTVQEDHADTTDVISTAVSPDFSALKLAVVGHGKFGSVRMRGNDIIYTPQANFIGKDTVAYCVHDGENDTTLAYMCYNVVSVNDAPVAVDDSYTHKVQYNNWSAMTLTVTDNDSDPDGATVQGQVVIDIQPLAGQVLVGVDPLELVYTPDSGFVGVDSLAYHLLDQVGAVSNSAWVYVNTTKVAKTLQAINDTITVSEDVFFSFNPMANDSDSAGDSIFLKMDSVDLKSVGGVHRMTTPNGFIELFSDSVWHYNPAPNFYGADTAYYYLSNAYGETDLGTIFIEVLPVNDAPLCDERPSLAGVVMSDSVLRCDTGRWSDVDGEMSYAFQWFGIGTDGTFAIAAGADTLVVADSLLGTDIYCEVLTSDNGYPLPGMSTMAWSDTLAQVVYRPSGIVVSQDTIYRSWKDESLVALLACEGEVEMAHTFELMNGVDTFFIVDNQLYLDTAAYYIAEDSVTLSIKVTHADMGGLSSVFEVTFALIDDLMPVMIKTYPYIYEIFGDSVTVAVKADKLGSVYYEVQESGSIIPKAKDMNHAMKSYIAEEEEALVGIGHLESQKDYEILIYLSDTSDNHYSEAYVIPFTTVDIVAPEFYDNSPYVLRCTEDSAYVIVRLDEAAELSYTLYENDRTVAISGDFIIDSSLIAEQTFDCAHADNQYCIAIGGLRSQIVYQMVLNATDNLNNNSEDITLDFCTHDTVAPFFPGRQPYIKQIIDGRISYQLGSSEEGLLYTRLAYAKDEASDFTSADPLGLYSETNTIEENEVLSVETMTLTMDGLYRLDFALEDSAGNTSIMKSVEFTYPQAIGMNLFNAFIYQGDELVFSNVTSDTQYDIITMNGAVLRYGSLDKDDPRVGVDFLNNGTYLIHVSNRWESRTFQFVKTIRQRGSN